MNNKQTVQKQLQIYKRFMSNFKNINNNVIGLWSRFIHQDELDMNEFLDVYGKETMEYKYR